ncbi:uncharacterized protein LOC128229959 [Mya arenaria]|uniref:uncharacterized protein LOC128229959 n=1 Tax=Mya arenaria TaxID=6604 RepID=UPI0022E58829|nr:uncharacterized protein LOC128229959 [Mya arenaria]
MVRQTQVAVIEDNTPALTSPEPSYPENLTCLEKIRCCQGDCSCGPFIHINQSFNNGAKLITGYGIALTVWRWIIGLAAVITLAGSCAVSGTYCLVKAAKESIFWAVVLYLHNRDAPVEGQTKQLYHIYLVVDLIISVIWFCIGCGLYALGCEGDDRNAAWTLALLTFLMDTFLPHVALLLAALACIFIIFCLAATND